MRTFATLATLRRQLATQAKPPAGKAAGGKKSAAKGTAAAPTLPKDADASSTRSGMASGWDGLHYLKTGAAPSPRPASEYPDWLWELLSSPEQVTLQDLRHEYDQLVQQGGVPLALERMGHDKIQRLLKLSNKEDIREQNARGKTL